MANSDPTPDPSNQRTPEDAGGDQITVGNITNATGVAIGRGATAIVQTILNLPRYLIVIIIIAALLIVVGGVTLTGAQFSGFRQTLREARLLPPAFASEQPGETLIVIAPFFHPQGVPDDQEAKLIQIAIEEQMATLGMNNLRVDVDDGLPIEANDRDGAMALGERYHASMVIWGSNTRPQITVNYLNLRQPNFAAAQAKLQETGVKGRTQIANPSAYAGFITNDLPKSMAFLSLFAVGQSAYINEDYPNATTIISGAVDLLKDVNPTPPGSADAYFRLGWLFQVPGQDDDRALKAYSQALALDQKLSWVYNNRGNVRRAKGDLDGAIADFNQALALDPKLSWVYNNRGNVRRANGDLDGAIADYNQALALDPKFAQAYYNRGNVRRANGDLDGAIADYNQALALDPKFAQAYTNRGAARQANGDLDGAIADYNQALALDPKDADAYTNRGAARQANGDLDGAIADYNQALALDPKYAATYNNRGLARYANGDLDGAIADYNQALALDPKLAQAYYNRGNVRRANGDLDGAIADYNQALTLNPKYAATYNNRGLARYANGDLDGAIADYNQALALDPKYDSAYYNRGLIYKQRKQRDLAIADFRKARDLTKNQKYRQDAIDRLKELGVNE